jgi:hypothetical protein
MYLISFLEWATWLDRLAGPGQRAARLLRPGRVRDALHGVWLGHPLHPVLAQVPVGAWPSAGLLDAWPGSTPGTEAASRRLVLAGLAASVPAALAGSADWSELHEQQMRSGSSTRSPKRPPSLSTRRQWRPPPAPPGGCGWPG